MIGVLGTAMAIGRAPDARVPLFLIVVATFAVVAAWLDVLGRDRRARLLGGAYWTVAAAFGGSGIRWLAREYPSNWPLHLLDLYRPDLFLGPFLRRFAAEFPRVMRFTSLDTVCFWGGRVAMSVASLVALAQFVPGTATVLAAHRFLLAVHHWLMQRRFKRARTPTDRHAARFRGESLFVA